MKYALKNSLFVPRLSTIVSCVVVGLGATVSQPVGSTATYLVSPTQRWQQDQPGPRNQSARPDRSRVGQANRQRPYPAASKTNVATRPAQVTVVNHCGDSGPGSLREAVDNAVTGDEIDLTGLTCNTITLTSGRLAVAVDDLTITGPGRDALTIDGNTNDLILNHYPGVSLTLSGLTLSNGKTAEGFGGCVWASGNLELRDSRVTGCVAGDETNTATYGAGLDVLGDVTLKNSIVTGNTATNGVVSGAYHPSVFGGGIYAGGGVRVKYGSEVSNNLASAQSGNVHGGGIYARGGVTVFDAAIIDNRAEAVGVDGHGGPAFGGGFKVRDGQVSVIFSKIQDNTVYSRESWVYGGGLEMLGFDASTSRVDFQFSTISGNTARSGCDHCDIGGGGVRSFSPVEIKNSTVNNNTLVLSGEANQAFAEGGAIQMYMTTLKLTNSTVSGNRALNDTGYGKLSGGGIAMTLGLIFISHSTIAFNQASRLGGGILLSGGTGSSLVSSIVANNQATYGPDIASFDALDLSAGSNNLIMTSYPDVTLPSDTLTSDPQLQPLADNGGLTWTHALVSGSPAIDKGINTTEASADQRGSPYLREWGAGPDIGAFELQPDPTTIFSNEFE